MFIYGQDRQTGQYVIVDRDYTKVKKQLLEALTNFGNPIIKVVDGNVEVVSEGHWKWFAAQEPS